MNEKSFKEVITIKEALDLLFSTMKSRIEEDKLCSFSSLIGDKESEVCYRVHTCDYIGNQLFLTKGSYDDIYKMKGTTFATITYTDETLTVYPCIPPKTAGSRATVDYNRNMFPRDFKLSDFIDDFSIMKKDGKRWLEIADFFDALYITQYEIFSNNVVWYIDSDNTDKQLAEIFSTGKLFKIKMCNSLNKDNAYIELEDVSTKESNKFNVAEVMERSFYHRSFKIRFPEGIYDGTEIKTLSFSNSQLLFKIAMNPN